LTANPVYPWFSLPVSRPSWRNIGSGAKLWHPLRALVSWWQESESAGGMG